MWRPAAIMVLPQDVIEVLNEAKVSFVLMGTYAVSGWRSEPRATQDVDVLVEKKDHRKAVAAVRRAFPKLRIRHRSTVTRFFDPDTGNSFIDLMKPTEAVFQAVFGNTVPAGRTHRIPDLEMSLVTKFAAMISPHRSRKRKYLDSADFLDIVEANRELIDTSKLKNLANLVCRGGGAKIIKFLKIADEGGPFEL
jgi:hypothetical protein